MLRQSEHKTDAVEASTPVKATTLSGRPLKPIGFGTMGAVDVYALTLPGEQTVQLFTEVLRSGCNVIDTALIYGDGRAEAWLGRAIKAAGVKREDLFLCTKGGLFRKNGQFLTNGTEDALSQHCKDSLERLCTNYIDVYYIHRLDEHTDLAESLKALVNLQRKGLVRFIGLSEVTGEIIQKAVAILTRLGSKLNFIQNEYSLMSRDVEVDGTLQACAQHGISFVAYSPIGRGLFSSKDKAFFDTLPSSDIRKAVLPRYQTGQIENNVDRVKTLRSLAEKHECTTTQLALAWLLERGQQLNVQMIPIPGTTSVKHFNENMHAQGVFLTLQDRDLLSQAYPLNVFSGIRWPSGLISSELPAPAPTAQSEQVSSTSPVVSTLYMGNELLASLAPTVGMPATTDVAIPPPTVTLDPVNPGMHH